MAEILDDLRNNLAQRERLMAERDELILRARAAGVPVVRIDEAVGLSAMHVHRIIAARRG